MRVLAQRIQGAQANFEIDIQECLDCLPANEMCRMAQKSLKHRDQRHISEIRDVFTSMLQARKTLTRRRGINYLTCTRVMPGYQVSTERLSAYDQRYVRLLRPGHYMIAISVQKQSAATLQHLGVAMFYRETAFKFFVRPIRAAKDLQMNAAVTHQSNDTVLRNAAQFLGAGASSCLHTQCNRVSILFKDGE
ncbi:hypothetical protein DUW70_16040 [Stenotrophomonas maltophilia]|nr:hypothetical protein DUW70_16040 [Stenotrophomonas maltophilia]